MEIRLRVEDHKPTLMPTALSLRSWLRRNGWETGLVHGTNTVTVLLPEEGDAARLARSVVEWRDGHTSGTPDVVPETADGTPVPGELVRILAEVTSRQDGGTITVLEPDDYEAVPTVPDPATRIAGDWHVGPPGPVLDPDDDWDRD
jgi:hypothetical protein